MGRRPFRVPKIEASDELPSSPGIKTSHHAPVSDMVSLRLSTGQTSSEDEVSLIAELWAGEQTLIDPKSQTEVTVWFEKSSVRIHPIRCEIKSGSRRHERLPPHPTVTRAQESTERTIQKGIAASARAKVGTTSLVPDLMGAANGEIRAIEKTTTKAITRREYAKPPNVVAGPDMWEVRSIGDGEGSRGASRFKYISADEPICDLLARPKVKHFGVDAEVRVFPSDLGYRIKAKNSMVWMKEKLSINQDRVIKLLLSKGIAPLDHQGLKIADAQLRIRRGSKTKP